MKSLWHKISQIMQEKEFLSKIISVVLAIILWAYVSSTKMGEEKFKIPLEFIDLPEYLTVSEQSDSDIIILLEGAKELIQNVNSKNIKASVDLSNPRVNSEKRYPVDIIRNQIPESIRVTPVKRYIRITIERKVEKKVRVVPQINARLQDGDILGDCQADPEYVLIKGAASKIDKIDAISTMEIFLNNETGVVVRNVRIERENLKNITLPDTEIKVTIPIYQLKNLTSIDVPVIVRNTKKGFIYDVRNKRIKVYLKNFERENPVPDLFNVFIDAAEFDSDKIISAIEEKGFFEDNAEINVYFKEDMDKGIIVAHRPEIAKIKIFREDVPKDNKN